MTQHTLDGSEQGNTQAEALRGVTRRELIERLKIEHPDLARGVTPQTLGNWEDKGYLTALNPGEKPRLYNADTALAQAIRHITNPAKGGKREGAGRPKKTEDTPLIRAAEREKTKRDTLALAKERGENGERPEHAIHIEDLLTIDFGTLELLCSVCDEVKLTPRQADLLGKLLDNRRKFREEQTAEGSLVRASEVRVAMHAKYAAVRNAIESMIPTLADDAIQIARGEPTRRGELVRAIKSKVENSFAELGGDVET